jgi:D-alanyl-D-alanine carboxypeptidase (penicillin-binding protein 5/6)
MSNRLQRCRLRRSSPVRRWFLPLGLAALLLWLPASSLWAGHRNSITLAPETGLSRAFTPAIPRLASSAHSILLKNLTDGRVLYQYQPARRLFPASLTKIMSALVILERAALQEPVTISRRAASAPSVRLRLMAGQVFELGDLVKAMLITSANDACLAAAEHVGGSEEGFVALMNDKAAALGLGQTRFSNACGFDTPNHYSTANDLAILSEAAMQHPIFRAFVREEIEVIKPINAGRYYLLRNTNRLLGRMPGVEGVKTGFTSRAGRCLIVKVSQDGKELLLVLLHATRRWNTATDLIQYGIDSLQNNGGATGVPMARMASQRGSLGGRPASP